ncbi:MAG: integrase, partial [Paracoccus sp. (in: a-proteobacteria)]
MSQLRNALADYLTMRRALGYKMDKAERLVGQFVAFAEDRGETHVRIETALAWATRPEGAAAIWISRRLAEARLFARHL